jgi:uncharacterized protein (DUF2147 family)
MENQVRASPILFALLPVLAATPHASAEDASILGRWAPMDGSAVIAVAPCARQAGLCAVVEQEMLAVGEQSLLGQVVVRDLVPAGQGRWRGRYVESGVNYGASVRLVSTRVIEFRVCVAPLLCQTERYQRAGA